MKHKGTTKYSKGVKHRGMVKHSKVMKHEREVKHHGIMKHGWRKNGETQQNNETLKNGEAQEEVGPSWNLAPFCKIAGCLFVKLPLKEVLKESLRGYIT